MIHLHIASQLIETLLCDRSEAADKRWKREISKFVAVRQYLLLYIEFKSVCVCAVRMTA